MAVAESMQKKSLDSPDETRTFDQGRSQVVSIGDFTVTKNTLEPGWRWSEHVKPITGTDSCQILHTGYVVSGRLKVAMDDGSEEEFASGDAYVIPPGHDAWIEGDELAWLLTSLVRQRRGLLRKLSQQVAALLSMICGHCRRAS
jgi:quercetin dioxygenase-like cupin family protein